MGHITIRTTPFDDGERHSEYVLSRDRSSSAISESCEIDLLAAVATIDATESRASDPNRWPPDNVIG